MEDTYFTGPTQEDLVNDFNEHVWNPSMLDGDIDENAYDQRMFQWSSFWKDRGKHIPGLFHLRGWRDDSMKTVVEDVMKFEEGGTGIDWNPEEGKDKTLKARFDAALDGSYASAYKYLKNGTQIYEDIGRTAWHIFQMQKTKNNTDVDTALKDTFSMMFGNTILERNGGVEFPNGVGLWHDREAMNNYGLTLNEMEDYKINVYHHLIKNLTAEGSNSTIQFESVINTDKHWDEVADGIVNGGGSIFLTVINDVYTDGYRVVVAAQGGDMDASPEVAGQHMFVNAYSKKPSIRIIGNAYVNDGTGAKPIRLTKDQYFNAIGEASAAEYLDANLDFWDRTYFLYNKNKTIKTGAPWNQVTGTFNALAERGFLGMRPGPDMSRERVEYWNEKFGPGTENYKNKPRATRWFFDTTFGLDWADPGKLEMDLLWIPLWNDIKEFEAKKSDGKHVTDDELETLFRNKYRSMFKGRNDLNLRNTFSVYDMLSYIKIPEIYEDTAEEEYNKDGTQPRGMMTGVQNPTTWQGGE